jgi:DNA primase
MTQCFNKSKLPEPIVYYSERNFRLKGNRTWRTTVCPFHEDTKPSLAIHVEKGAFKCFSCGAKGGDVIAFHRLLHKMSFVDACKDLGEWEAL